MLGDHGFTSKVLPYETSTHVPLWVYGDQIEKGINHSLVSNLDVLPTILELAGLKTPPDLDGSSLLPLLRREKSKIRDYFIYEGLGTYGGTKPNLTLLWEDLRYIVTFRDESLSRVEFKELYNCRSDSLEMINLVFSEKYSTLIPSMDSILSEFKQRSLSNLN
jgi:arylsulfatase A-like enzyme